MSSCRGTGLHYVGGDGEELNLACSPCFNRASTCVSDVAFSAVNGNQRATFRPPPPLSTFLRVNGFTAYPCVCLPRSRGSLRGGCSLSATQRGRPLGEQSRRGGLCCPRQLSSSPFVDAANGPNRGTQQRHSHDCRCLSSPHSFSCQRPRGRATIQPAALPCLPLNVLR